MTITLIVITLVASDHVLSTLPNFFPILLYLIFKTLSKSKYCWNPHFKIKKNKFRECSIDYHTVNVGPIWCQYMLNSYWVDIGTSNAPGPWISYHDAIVISLTMHLFGTWPCSKFSTCFKSFNAHDNLWDKNYCFCYFHLFF